MPALVPALDQSLRGQHLHRLAIGAARDVQRFRERDLARERGARGVLARHDRHAQFPGDGAMQPPSWPARVGGRRHGSGRLRLSQAAARHVPTSLDHQPADDRHVIAAARSPRILCRCNRSPAASQHVQFPRLMPPSGLRWLASAKIARDQHLPALPGRWPVHAGRHGQPRRRRGRGRRAFREPRGRARTRSGARRGGALHAAAGAPWPGRSGHRGRAPRAAREAAGGDAGGGRGAEVPGRSRRNDRVRRLALTLRVGRRSGPRVVDRPRRAQRRDRLARRRSHLAPGPGVDLGARRPRACSIRASTRCRSLPPSCRARSSSKRRPWSSP